MQLISGNRTLDLSTPQVMGILNVTPDSFSDGGQFQFFEHAINQASQMVQQGAAIIDIGGESTRPGAEPVSLDEELSRTIPVIEKIANDLDVWISIDTSKAQVMKEAVAAGAHLINDVCALQEEGALEVAAQCKVPVCLMHMQGAPRSMQVSPSYEDVAKDITRFFMQRISACREAGIDKSQIILDPGFGFGKTLDHNYQLLQRLKQFSELGYPLLTGLSRKSMFGDWLGRTVEQRLAASLAGVLLCAQQGANIVRVHDVQETSDVLKVLKKTIES
ncbi:dihydropteroate synthase [Motilimonas cestriensis]|uniref:Dihydropteroate synthase n=1 Tax=Motilimonas cestriensis TaxID=2742685 RepID=A0ABS8W884_9GAMM|nr:dihydropteroate synthase [Motilimonas cestriensis]MCE2593741.1 dihydropteroate synthase [Motilimonas cestriensis]